MIKMIDIQNMKMADEVLAMQKSSYKVEAEIIGFMDIPPLLETVEELMNSGETFIGSYIGEQLAGAVSYKIIGNKLDIHRVMVHPLHFRKGIAKNLLIHLEEFQQGIDQIIVSTGSLNLPAIELYTKLGFELISKTKTKEGLSLAHFQKEINS